ncbi:MAG: hypothetical protein LQ349_008481, partial [Xanthoria aureola]
MEFTDPHIVSTASDHRTLSTAITVSNLDTTTSHGTRDPSTVDSLESAIGLNGSTTTGPEVSPPSPSGSNSDATSIVPASTTVSSTSGTEGVTSTVSSTSQSSNTPSRISTHAILVPSEIKATDGSDRATGNAVTGFGGFPPPSPPPDPAKEPDDSPTGSQSQSQGTSNHPTSPTSISTSRTSSSSSSSSTGTCAPIATVADPGPTPAADDVSPGRRRRGLESRILVAREAPVISMIGSCKLTTPVNIPSYSTYARAMNLNRQRNANGGKNAKIYDAIQKWYAESIEIDGTPFLGSKLENPFNHITGPGSIDHVWEKSNVGDFLGSLLGSDFDCDDMNSLFSACGVKLQKIFDQLPSMDPNNVQTGFVAMNKNLNGMKGWMFSQKFADARFGKIYDTDAKIIQGFERQAIIFDWFNSDSGIQSMHDETNNRIYSAFVALDDAISSTKIRRAKGRGDILLQFGPTYKKWYLQLLENVGSATFAWASGQVARLSADTSLPECLQKATNVFQSSPLYGEDKFKIDPSHLSWRATTISLQKRGLVFVRDKTCVPPSNTKSSTSASSTTISSTDSFTSSSTPTKIQPSSTGTSDPKPSAVPKPTATPQPQRTCSLHLWQDRQYGRGGGRGIFDDPDVPHTYFVKVKIFDGTGEDKKEIGHHDRAKAGDADPLRVTIDKLTDPLVIQPEVRNDYIQFALGKQRWASSDGGSCKVGGWDPRGGFPA